MNLKTWAICSATVSTLLTLQMFASGVEAGKLHRLAALALILKALGRKTFVPIPIFSKPHHPAKKCKDGVRVLVVQSPRGKPKNYHTTIHPWPHIHYQHYHGHKDVNYISYPKPYVTSKSMDSHADNSDDLLNVDYGYIHAVHSMMGSSSFQQLLSQQIHHALPLFTSHVLDHDHFEPDMHYTWWNHQS